MNGTKVTLRLIQKKDLEWARKLRNDNREYFFDCTVVSKAQQERWFNTLSYPFFVIELEGKPVGTVGVKKEKDHYEIHNVLIEGSYRKQGIFKEALILLQQKYGLPLYLEVQAANKNAVLAYQRLGFSLFAYRMKKT